MTSSDLPALANHIQRGDYFSERTQSVCPLCLQVVPAALCEKAAGLFMAKTCPEHGAFLSTVAPSPARIPAAAFCPTPWC